MPDTCSVVHVRVQEFSGIAHNGIIKLTPPEYLLHKVVPSTILQAPGGRSSMYLLDWNILGKVIPVRWRSSPTILLVPEMLNRACPFHELRLFPRCLMQ